MTFPARPVLRAVLAWAAAAGMLLVTACAGVPATEPDPASAPPAAAGSAPVAESALAPALPDAEAAAYLSQPLQPRTRLDPQQDAERVDLWQRLRDGFVLSDVDGELVRKWEQWYAHDPAYVQRMVERGGRYLFYIVEELQRRGLPTELALLPFIESAYNPQAQSRARASGMWQFMPATGKDFELRQNLFRDDRRGVLASTRAALDLLQRLNARFEDWPLALAAYNWGQGNVQKAIERNRRAGLATDYASLVLPQETREYLPKLQAMKNIVRRPEAYALALPALGNHPYFLGVTIVRDIDVALAARLAGLPLEEFQQLNPQMNKPVILAAGTPQVLLPYDNANRFIRELATHRGVLASWTAWVVPKTLKPSEAARLTGMDEARLREVNLIPPRMVVKLGSTLMVQRPAHATADVDMHTAEHAELALAPEAPPLRRVSFKAGRHGDSVAAVARRYRVSAQQVALWNEVPLQSRFQAGQAVVVMLPAAARKARAAAAPQLARAAPAAPRKGPAAQRLHVAQAAPR